MIISHSLRAASDKGPVGNPWDVSSAVWDGGSSYGLFSVRGQEANPSGVFFKPDGLKMYIVGAARLVFEYNLSTAWDISTASFLQSFSIAAQEASPTGLFFKPDGLKMYIIGSNGDEVNEYNLSTAWDISTASFLQLFSVAAEEIVPQDLFFKPDGTKMYVIGATGDDVNQYDLSTAWDISTASFFQLFSVAAQETTPTGLFFKPDGTKMYVLGQIGDDVNEYNLSTAWDISTASFLQLFSVAAQEASPAGLFFRPDGTKMYVIGSEQASVLGYDLGTAWDVATAVWDAPTQNYFSVSAQEISPQDVFFKPDGLKMYVIGTTGDDVNEYNLSTAWDISTASFLQLFSVVAQEAAPNGIFFKPDGLKMYITGSLGDDVNEYNLSTAWDISTASFLQLFSVAAQELEPTGLFFKPDGLKMYIIGTNGDEVNEYNLSTAWDISTASFLQLFSVATQEAAPQAVFFKPDGLKMYVLGQIGDDVNEYNLSTAWDISTASFLQLFSVAAQDTQPNGVFFKPDGTKMYIMGAISDAIWAYDL